MKIALISESPSVTTGFGVHAGHLTKLLAELQHEVVVFGVCAQGQPFDTNKYPCRIVPMPRDQFDAIEYLPDFLADEQPDLLFIHYDLGAISRFYTKAQGAGWNGPTIAHFVIDTIPFNPSQIDVLREFVAALTPTQAAADYCASLGLTNIIAAPHPVDATLFQPLANRDELRQAAGLANTFVVGMFGRNVERKQQPRSMLAFQKLVKAGLAEDLLLYLHCQPRNEDPWLNSWYLPAIAQQLGIKKHVLFPGESFRQLAGIPYQVGTTTPIMQLEQPSIPTQYSYVERLNLCDLVLNVPYAGAFELAPLEAALCGVPAAVTNDHSAMAEVVGDGALLLEAADIGIHSSGGWQYFVGAQTIADAILALKNDSGLRADLIRRGRINALRYTEEPLRQGLRKSIEACEHWNM